MAENPEASLNDILTQFVPQVPSILSDPENLYGASIGAGMGGGFYTVGALAGYPGRKAREKAAKALEEQQRKAEEAVATSAWFKTLIDESDKLDLKGKTELFQEYLRSGHISGLPETAYLTPEGVLELEAGGLLEAVGLDAEKAMQDAWNGRDVRVSVPQVVAGVTGENAESVVRHLKLSTEGISAAQAETLDPGESFRRTQEMLEGYHARTRASDDIRQELVAQYLNAKPGADLMEAEAETAPLVAFAEKIGPVAGMTPDEYIKERLAGIVGEDVGVQAMGEAAQGLGQDKSKIEVSGAELGEGLSIKALRKAAMAKYGEFIQAIESGELEIVNQDLGVIKLNNSGKKKVQAGSADARKLQLVPYLPELLRMATGWKTEPNYKDGRSPNIKQVHQAAVSVVLDGKPVEVTLTVRETEYGEFHYDLWVGDRGRGVLAKQKAPKKGASGDAIHGADRNAVQRTGNKAKGDILNDNIDLYADGVNIGLRETGHVYHDGKRGSISTIADGRHVIRLFGAANKSTLLHETGHFFFLEYERIVESGKAPEWMKRDYEALRQWSGLDKARSEDEKRAAHENIARGFEAYLRTGKAPSLPLQRYFSMFKRWLTAIYRSVRELDVKLTPAVRDVFDRALATDDQIAEMRHAEEESRRPFRDVAEAIPGLTEAELKELEELESEAEAEAYAILDAKLNRDRQKRILEWTKEAVDIWNETRLGQFLTDGKIGIEGMKVDFDASTVRSILRKRPGKVVKGGLPYDMAATQYGYEDGEAMVMELLEGPTKTEFVQQYLDQLEARHDRTLLEDHEGQSEAHVRFLDLQAELLARKLSGYKPVTREELEAKARGSVDGMAPAEVRDFADRTRKALNDLGREVAEVRKALEAAIRERDTAQKTRNAEAERLRNEKAQAEAEGRADAMRESNRADAAENRAVQAEGVIPVIEKERARLYRAVERQRQLHADYKAAQHAKQEQKRIVSYLKRVGKAAKNGKAMTADANEQIRTVLDGLDLRNVSNRELDRRENLAAWVQAREMEGIPYPLPERVIADLGRVHYKRMSLEDLREISMLVKFIETQGRADKKAIVAGERYEFNEVRQKLVETVPTCQTVVCDLDIVDEFCFGSL